MKTLQGVLFDKDGTILSFNDIWGAWCEKVVAQLAPADQALQHRLSKAVGYNPDTHQFEPGALVVSASADETNDIWAQMLNQSPEHIEQIGLAALDDLPVSPVTDLNAVFTALRSAGLTLGVATNDYEAVAHRHLSSLGVDHHFDFICGFDSGFGSKPGPGMIRAFSSETNCQIERVAMVGDSTHDLHAGRAAGAGLLVAVLTGPASETDLSTDAHMVLNDISELPHTLQQRGLI